MTDNEFETCCEAVKTYIVDAESAEEMQELSIRLKSAAETLRSTLQECVSIYDEIEQRVNRRTANPISVLFDEEGAYAVQQESEKMHSMIHSSILEKMRLLESQNIVWYAEEEPVEVQISGEWVPAWHIENDGETAAVCLEYLGSPRTSVPLSSIRRRQEQE